MMALHVPRRVSTVLPTYCVRVWNVTRLDVRRVQELTVLRNAVDVVRQAFDDLLGDWLRKRKRLAVHDLTGLSTWEVWGPARRHGIGTGDEDTREVIGPSLRVSRESASGRLKGFVRQVAREQMYKLIAVLHYG